MLKQLSEGKLYVPLLQAIDIYTDMGRFTIAAKHHETIAGIFESEVDLFKMHSSLTSPDSNQFSQCADLDKAMQHYEQVAKKFRNLIFPQEEVFFHFTAFPFFFHQAADYFKGEESNSSANKCMLKVLSIRLQKKALHMKLVFHTKQGHSNLENYVIEISFRLLSMPQPWKTTTRQSKFMNRSPTSVQLTNTTSDIVKV